MIPDSQVKPGVPIDHLSWIGRYIVDQFGGKPNVKVIHLGDFWDLPSLSSYDKGKKSMEGRRYMADVEAGNVGMEVLNEALASAKRWKPDLHLLRGNHENRIERAIEADAQLDGLLTMDDLLSPGWKVHDFLVPVVLDGVTYAHFFYAPMSGRPYGGMVESRLKTIGFSFTQGHQQTLGYGVRFVGNRSQHGLVAGSAYLHSEDYRGPQGNHEWRGIIVCHEVRDGSYDPMFVSLDFLCRKYEGKPLAKFRPRVFA